MKLTPLERKLNDLIAPVVTHKGYRLVSVRVHGADGANTVQIMAENPATRRLGVDECAVLSREIAALMDVEDPIKSAYRLEVSSPGIDRPLISLQDFADFSGFEAKVEIEPGLEGRKRFKGRITGLEDELILMDTEEGPVKLPFAAVQKAKLVLTDELLKATKQEKTETH